MPTPSHEHRPLPCVQSWAGSRQLGGREGGTGDVSPSCIPWSPFGPQKGRANAAAQAGQSDPGLGQRLYPAPRGRAVQAPTFAQGWGQQGLTLSLLSTCRSQALKELWVATLLR